jgi:hypothetical protein
VERQCDAYRWIFLYSDVWDIEGGVGVRARESTMDYPDCKKCNDGLLLPLSDYGRDGAPIRFKAWVCHNPECGFSIRIDNGEISLGKSLRESVK